MCHRELVSLHSNAALQTKSMKPNIDNVWENTDHLKKKRKKHLQQNTSGKLHYCACAKKALARWKIEILYFE